MKKKFIFNLSLPFFIICSLILFIAFAAFFRMSDLVPYSVPKQLEVKAEKEILYRDAEIQNVRKRMMAEKSAALVYGTLPLARRMLTILADIDRALAVNEDDFLKMIRAKLWTELSSDGVSEIEAKGLVFDPVKMEAVTMIPSSDEYPPHIVVEVLEAGFTFKDRVIFPSKVVVASE